MLRLRKVADRSGPEPPRNVPDGDGRLPRPDLAPGALVEPWPLAGVELDGDLPATHRFSIRMVDQAVTEGWMTLGRGRITIHTMSGDVMWRIVRKPGAYCVHCGAAVGSGPAGRAGEVARRRLHTDGCCGDGGHPDDAPAGYEVLNGWEVELEEDRRG